MHLSGKVYAFLRPADQDVPEAVHPRVRSLNNPSPCPEASARLNLLRLLCTRPYVGNKVEPLQKNTHFVVVVALVKTHTLRFSYGGTWSVYGNTLDRFLCYLEIVLVSACYSASYRYAASVGQKTPL